MSHHNEFLTSAETAALLSIRNNTLEIWRSKGKGPEFRKLGISPQSCVRYERAAVERWLAEHTYRSTSAYTVATDNDGAPEPWATSAKHNNLERSKATA